MHNLYSLHGILSFNKLGEDKNVFYFHNSMLKLLPMKCNLWINVQWYLKIFYNFRYIVLTVEKFGKMWIIQFSFVIYFSSEKLANIEFKMHEGYLLYSFF